MRFAFVTEAVPNPGTVGGDVISWAVVKQMREAGHTVVPCCCLINQWARRRPGEIEKKVSALSNLGVQAELFVIPTFESLAHSSQRGSQNKWRRRFQQLRDACNPNLANLYPSVVLERKLKDTLERAHPDAILVFDTGTVAALQHLRVAPSMAIPGDPPHLVHRYRRRLNRAQLGLDPAHVFNSLIDVVTTKRLPRRIIQMLRQYESVVFLGAQHAAWVRDNGVDCLYLRPPVADTAGPQWRKLRNAHIQGNKPKILILGHLTGTASLTGLYSFAEKTLPALERALGSDGFEVHLVGRGPLPEDLEKSLKRPSVHLRGYVEDAASEFLSATVFLSPTPYPVGVRIRVVEAFSFGCCVVTHHDSALGLPELVDGENVLLAAEGVGWADAIVRALNDSALRKQMGEKARETYEQCFTPAVAAGRIVAELERLAKEFSIN